MRWREESVAGRGARLHVRRVVDPPAPPVVLLHGLGVDGSIWQAFARRLLPDLAAVVPDLRGHGQSDAPVAGYTPADYAADLIAFLDESRASRREHVRPDGDAIGPEDGLEVPIPVVGHSLGALVALKLAALRPDLVKWLVLLDPPLDPTLRNPEIASVSRLRHAPPGQLEAYLLDRNPGGGTLLAQVLAKLFRQASDATFDAFLDPVPANSPNADEPTSALDVVVQRQVNLVDDALEAAPEIQVPCLVIQADPAHGGVLGDAAASDFVGRLPHGRLLSIPGATHAVHASHPAEVARAILAFNR